VPCSHVSIVVKINIKCLFQVDKILKERTVDGEQQLFVSYKHYGRKFDRWIWKKDLTIEIINNE